MEHHKNVEATLDEYSYRLSKAAKDFCNKEPEILIGFTVWNNEKLGFFEKLSQLRRDRYVGLKKKYNLDERYRVKNVYNGSPAYKAGLRDGDIILKAGYIEASNEQGENKNFLKDWLKLNKSIYIDNIQVTYIRNNDVKSITYKPEVGCYYEVLLDSSAESNAYADGKAVYITKSMYKDLSLYSKDAKAIILGHEFAHNIMKHPEKSNNQAAIGSIIGYMIDPTNGSGGVDIMANSARGFGSKEDEKEADYVGLYIAARAGYNYKEAKDIWQKMSVDSPHSLYLDRSHPNNAKRSAALKKTINEIDEKVAKHEELIPNGLDKK